MANAASSLDISSISSMPRDIPSMTSAALPLLYPTSQALVMPSQFSTNSSVCCFSNLESMMVAASAYRSTASLLTSSTSLNAVAISIISLYSSSVFGTYERRPSKSTPNLSIDTASSESLTSVYSFPTFAADAILPL